MPYQFLSGPWLEEVQRLATGTTQGVVPDSVEINLVVTGGPGGDRQLHVADGSFAPGLLDACPTTLTVPYQVAREIFVEGDQSAVMSAFMRGLVKVEGDISRLMVMQAQLQSSAGEAAQAELLAKLRHLTVADD